MEFVSKKCFFTDKEGKKRMMLHRSVILDNGMTIRCHKGTWKIVHPEKLVPAVATSLSRYAICAAQAKGVYRSEVEEFILFPKFLERLAKLTPNGIDVVTFLIGGK